MSEYNLITCIAQRGRKDDVVTAAIDSGAHGITYFDAEGTGTRQKLGLKGLLIARDKQVFLIVSKQSDTATIFDAISKAAKLSEPAHGFAFITPVSAAVGFLVTE